jgi:peptidoglycan hydrolase CwlO-like protein
MDESVPKTCAYHKEHEKRFEKIERSLPKMNNKISIGIGVVISAMLLATVLFGAVDAIKVDANNAQQRHEKIIDDKQSFFESQLTSLGITVSNVSIQIATVDAEIKNLREDLREDRAALKELTKYLRNKGDK